MLFRSTRRLLQARVEKWQLAPPNEPSPPRDQVLPFVQRPVDSRQLYTEQVAVVNTRLRSPLASGFPLTLDFEALFDRPRRGREADVVLTAGDLRDCMKLV